MSGKKLVLDASALMAFFENQPGAQEVESLLRHAAESRHHLLMSVVGWGEVFYATWRSHGRTAAEEKEREMAQLPIDVIDVDMVVTRIAATLKAECGLPYADCFAAALAMQRKATLVTTDSDFGRVGGRVGVLTVGKRRP